MCPLWPLHIIVMYLLMMCPLWFVSCQVLAKLPSWSLNFTPQDLLGLGMEETASVQFSSSDLSSADREYGVVTLVTADGGIASAKAPTHDAVYRLRTERYDDDGTWKAAFNVTGNFLGYTDVRLQLRHDNSGEVERESPPLKVTVVRRVRVIDRVFTTSVIVLVSIIFINFGCALDWPLLKQSVQKPVGPVIGVVSHFLVMPLLSFGLGLLLFGSSTALRLGFFFTGISPAGGASNIWTYCLGGNLNLSVTMTTVSTLVSLVMIPAWVFSLGQLIFAGSQMVVPYMRIATSAAGLVLPLSVGYLLQLYCPRASRLMVRVLKPFSALLITFIVVFAVITNFYLFKLFTWQIVAAGLGLPLLGYMAGWVLASMFNQPSGDVLAIAIETGLQNTGIAIFMLRFSLGQPEADLTTVAPVAVAVMTPLPLVVLYLVRKLRGTSIQHPEKAVPVSIDDPTSYTVCQVDPRRPTHINILSNKY